MTHDASGSVLARRLPWLLVFRATVAVALLVFTLVVDYYSWPLQRISALLYGVVGGTFAVVLILGLLLRAGISPLILSGVHLTTVLFCSALVVQGTGGVHSTLSTLYLLNILDGAILGGQAMALGMASASSLLYGLQLVLQLYAILPNAADAVPPPSAFGNALVSHFCAFYLSAWLAGHLAEMSRRASADAKSARSDLQRAELLHADVLAALPVGVLTLDATRRVALVNAAACRILRISRNALEKAVLPPVLAEFCASGALLGDVVLPHPDGNRTLTLQWSALRQAVGEQNDDLSILVIDDRTTLHHLEEQLQRRERLASIGQMSAAIAHELRNPLAAISGSVELICDGRGSKEERDKLGAIVLREIERLNLMVTDFLAFARPNPSVFAAIDVVTLARDVVAVLQQDSRCAEAGVQLHAPQSITAELDARQMRQVLWNLLKNALEASPPQAAVQLRLATTPAQRLCIEVRDTGSGFDHEARQHLFEPFFTSKAQGTGLGLAIVHSIVQAHGGVIEALTETPGTTMRVTLPLQQRA